MERVTRAAADRRAGEPPTLFLMVGLSGSGKTYRGQQLAAEHGAVHLTPDAWMLSIFGPEDRHQTRPPRDAAAGRASRWFEVRCGSDTEGQGKARPRCPGGGPSG